MVTLADVIIPAFYFPYVAVLFYPLSAVAALATEVLIFRWFYRSEPLAWLVTIVLIANVVSSGLGIALASILPSGLNPRFVRGNGGPAHGANWNRLAIGSWIVALVVSIAVEYGVLLLLTRRRRLARLGRAVTIANVTSYAVLLAVFQLSVYVASHAWRHAA